MKAQRTKFRAKEHFEREAQPKGPRPDFQSVHPARLFQDILRQELGPVLGCTPDEVTKSVEHWLSDLAHEFRMDRRTEEQQMVAYLIDRLKQQAV